MAIIDVFRDHLPYKSRNSNCTDHFTALHVAYIWRWLKPMTHLKVSPQRHFRFERPLSDVSYTSRHQKLLGLDYSHNSVLFTGDTFTYFGRTGKHQWVAQGAPLRQQTETRCVTWLLTSGGPVSLVCTAWSIHVQLLSIRSSPSLPPRPAPRLCRYDNTPAAVHNACSRIGFVDILATSPLAGRVATSRSSAADWQ